MEEADSNLLEIEKNILTADLSLVDMKINEILHILAKFHSVNPQKTKSEYKSNLAKLFCRFFGYNPELMEYLMKLFNPHECHSFLESMDSPRPMTIRLNTLKTRKQELVKALTSRGVNLEDLDESFKVGLKINASKVPIGATPEYLAGHYMLQSASSWLPVMALGPRPGDYVLDMTAAPGGKTTHIGQLMANQGVIVANDVKKERTKALFYNVQRMGITNCIVTNYDGRKMPKSMKNFDRVLLDAPCTGLGVISRDPSIKTNRTMRDIYRAGHLQRELLRAAIDHCKVGGVIVYSTCSVAVEENEAVVDYAVKNRFVRIEDTGINIDSKIYTKFGENRFHDRIKYCLRVFPHMHNLDGFFVCKLKKLRDGAKGKEGEEQQRKVEELRVKNKKNSKLAKKEKKKRIKKLKNKLGKTSPSEIVEETEGPSQPELSSETADKTQESPQNDKLGVAQIRIANSEQTNQEKVESLKSKQKQISAKPVLKKVKKVKKKIVKKVVKVKKKVKKNDASTGKKIVKKTKTVKAVPKKKKKIRIKVVNNKK